MLYQNSHLLNTLWFNRNADCRLQWQMMFFTNDLQRIHIEISLLHECVGENHKYVNIEMFWYVILFP